MAPEWTLIVDRSLSKNPSKENSDLAQNTESLKKLDIFALGVILADLACNPMTFMEQMKIDDNIRKQKLPSGYKLESTAEAELLLKLVSLKPDERPNIEEIKSEWLPRWEADLGL
jgi:hypothetical protein